MAVSYSTNARKNSRLAINLVAGVGFEPTTFWLWARRATRLLYPAMIGIILHLSEQKVKPLGEVATVGRDFFCGIDIFCASRF